jgi:hypothetical protein
MKRYKVNEALFLIFPIFVICIVLSYFLVLYKKSYTWINVVNIAIDGIILVYYFFKFCYEFSMDSQGINFYTIFKKRRVAKDDVINIRHSSFLTRVSFRKGSMYILTTPKGGQILKDIFKELRGSNK